VLAVRSASAQELSGEPVENPVYLADSPTASDSLASLDELIKLGNLDEASKIVDRTITTLGDRLIESDTPDVYIQIRTRFQRFTLAHRALLAAYRTRVTPPAKIWLDAGDWRRVTRNAWLTEPGMVATLHRAQTLIESAHFHAGIGLLEELETHPDADEHASEAAALALLAAQYINKDLGWSIADRWARRAGLAEPNHDAIGATSITPNPPAIGSLVWNADQPNQPISLDGIVPNALVSTSLSPESQLDQLAIPDQPRNSGANFTPSAWAAPLISDNLLYTNDGITLSCFDRFTLRPVWRLDTTTDSSEPPITPDARARLGRIIEDATSVTIVGDALYAPAGLPRSGSKPGPDRLLKLDAKSGKIQWSINIHELDESIADASIRGPIVVDNGVVIIGARTNNRRRRIISLAIVGIDSATGKLRWIRQIASAGSLPFQQIGQLAHSPILHDGVLYWTDRIGLGFAIESASGEILWARSLPPPDLYARSNRPPFANNTPVVNRFGLFTLTSDGTKILQLDLRSGKLIASRPAEPIGESFYLLAVDGLVACVSPSKITYYDPERFALSSTTHSPPIGDAQGIRGRAVVAGDRLVVPVESGVVLLDPTQPQSIEHIALNATGNIVALDGQIVVVDDMNASSFLAWQTASKMLDRRIAQDPSSAITLAELAFRAGRQSAIVPAVNRALGVISELPAPERTALNDQLFSVVLDMLEHTQSENTAQQKPSPQTNLLSAKDIKALLDHLETMAHTHRQVVAHRMAKGAWEQLSGHDSLAIGAYQDVLDEPTLSASMWEGAGIEVRGGLEAARRIATILSTLGYAPYRPFDRLAKSERIFLGENPNADELEELAKRYPWSTITPKIWLDAGALLKIQHRLPAAINAASEGLKSVSALGAMGIDTEQALIDQLAEQGISSMIATNRTQDAESLASTLTRQYPKLTLRIDGSIITLDQLAQRAQAATQLPILADAFARDAHPTLITGSPIKPDTRIDRGGIVLYAPQLAQINYVRAGRGAFEILWSRKSKSNEPPIIPWQDESRTIVLWPEGTETNNTGTLEAIETSTGKTVWSIEHLRTQIAEKSTRIPDIFARANSRFVSPTQGQVPTNQLLVVTDGHTIVISDRVGRAMGVDLFSGKRLWQSDLPTNRVHDLDLAGGVLGVCGLSVVDLAVQQQRGSTTSIVASIDPRTGQIIQIIDRFGQLPRWIRVGTTGNLFVATTERIVAINTKNGAVDWVLNDENLAESTSGWIIGDQLFVLDANTDLWALTLSDGAHSSRPLELRRRITPRGWVRVRSMVDTLVVAGSHGLAEFDHSRQLIGADAIDAPSPMIDAAFGTDRMVFLGSPTAQNDQSIAQLYLLDLHGARLLDTTQLTIPKALDRTPSSITAITGGVIVGYNEVSVFVRTMPATQ